MSKILARVDLLNYVVRWLEQQQELNNAVVDGEAWLEQYIKPIPTGITPFRDFVQFVRQPK